MAEPQWPLLYVGFNSRVVALSRRTGELVWDWKSPKGSGYPAMLVEVPHVYVSIMGYTYCLDAKTGEQLWTNPLSGMGTGFASLAVEGQSNQAAAAAAATAQQQQAAAS